MAIGAHCTATIYDASGRHVRRLFDGVGTVEPQILVWDGRSDGGTKVASGIYLVKVDFAGNAEHAKRLVVVR